MRIHKDLAWLARNVSYWDFDDVAGCGRCTHVRADINANGDIFAVFGFGQSNHPWRHITEWREARQQLGLEEPEVTAEEEEEWQRMEKEQSRQQYSAYYKDVRHIDTIDVYRVVGLFGCERHGHAISHAAKKLLLTGARTGGKDVETEVREAIDSLHRWLEMREEDKNAL